MLDENFSDIVSLLKKRQRSYNKFNDDYDRMTSNFIYLDKTHPTDRIKTEEELEIEKQNKLKKLEIQRMKEEEDEEDNEKEYQFN
jgi:ribosomal 50S subunit-recycling heat shock protein